MATSAPGGNREILHHSIRRIGLQNLTTYILQNAVVEEVTRNDRYLNYLIDKYRAVEREDDDTTAATSSTSTNTTSRLQSFPLMSLPPELRIRIYQKAFGDSRVLVDTGGRLSAQYHNSRRQLLQCNSQIRSEALGVFATCTELTYYGGDLESVSLITPPGFVESVRRLICLFFSPVGKILMKMPSLRVLEIEFRHTGVINDMPMGPSMEERRNELFVQLVKSDAVLSQGWVRDELVNENRKFAMLVTMEFSHQKYAEPFVKTCVDLDKGELLWKESVH